MNLYINQKYNKLFGDPYFGESKWLIVTYINNSDEKYIEIFKENNHINIINVTQIISIQYGYKGKWIEVKNKCKLNRNLNSNIFIYKNSGGIGHYLGGLNHAYYISNKLKLPFYMECATNHTPLGINQREWLITDKFNINNTIILSNEYENNKSYKGNGNRCHKNSNVSFKLSFIKDKKYIKKYNIKLYKNLDETNGNLDNIKYISIHFRNTDKKTPIPQHINKIKSKINKYKVNNIYLATDDYKFYDILKQNIKNCDIYMYTIIKEKVYNLHYNRSIFSKGENLFRGLLDIYMLQKGIEFIGNNDSNFSILVENYKFI